MRWPLVASSLLISLSLHAAEPVSDGTKRLEELGRIWGSIAYTHPYVWTRDVDWDAALLRALPKVRAADNEDDFARAVGDMLAALHDPATRIITRDPPATPPTTAAKPPPPPPLFEWPKPGVLLAHLGTAESLAPPAQAQLAAQLEKAERVIFDMRTSDGSVANRQAAAVTPLYRRLLGRTVYMPPRRVVVHDGYRTQTGWSSGGYSTQLSTDSAEAFEPDKGARRRQAVFIVDDNCDLPDVGMGMQAIGDAAFVLVGVKSIDAALTTGRWLPLGAHHWVLPRTREFVAAPGTAAPHGDAVLPADASEATVLKTALRLAGAMPRLVPSPPLPPLTWHNDKTYATLTAPDVDHRLLALFRMWNVIDRFYPYHALLDEPWDGQLAAFIPRFIAADGANAYAEAVAELGAKINDCHTGMRGTDDPIAATQFPPPLYARMIEKQPVIATVAPAATAAGARVGDVILTIDGEAAPARLARLHRYVACSNEGSCGLETLRRALSGAASSSLVLTVRGSDGKSRTVTVTRSTQKTPPMWRSGDIVRVMPGNIGYVDLDRLEAAATDAMFEQLKDTKAIIFDMRGYPHETAWTITPRIHVTRAVNVATFQRRFWRGDEPDAYQLFMQPLQPPRSDRPLYRGKTFMLVDERTISQAEHTGLNFVEAAGTKLVGSQSAGANGDVTVMVLPGSLVVSFSGHDVRHADGRQLQRVGLPVDVRVVPTIAGLQSGRDEVLERALQLANAK